MEQMEHTLLQQVINTTSWNNLEQNGTKPTISTLCGTLGTLIQPFGTLKPLIQRLFRVFQMFHGKYACHGEKKLIR